jgi:hypothetical protein
MERDARFDGIVHGVVVQMRTDDVASLQLGDPRADLGPALSGASGNST